MPNLIAALAAPVRLRAVGRIVAIVVASCALAACGQMISLDGVDLDFCKNVGPLQRVKVSPSQLLLQTGDSAYVTVSQLDARGNDRFLCNAEIPVISVNPAEVAKASSYLFGMWIWGAEPGSAVVRASVGSIGANVSVTVKAR